MGLPSYETIEKLLFLENKKQWVVGCVLLLFITNGIVFAILKEVTWAYFFKYYLRISIMALCGLNIWYVVYDLIRKRRVKLSKDLGGKFNQELWWLLQEIKTEQLRTVAGKKIDFFFRDNKTLSKDIQEKLFYKLNSEGRLELERIERTASVPVVSGGRVFRFVGVEETHASPSPLLELVGFRLTIHQEKLDELYHSYEACFANKYG